MPALRDLQTQFIDYLTGDDRGMESLVRGEAPEEPQVRLGIYKNAYRIRLRQAMETDHEILWIYLGDALFAEMVEGYITSHPSHYTSLRNFSDHLPRFLTTTAPFDAHPIIAEIATFERLLMDVFDAGDAQTVDLSALRALDPQDWPGLRLRFHPAVQLHKADWNSVECWKALKEETAPPAASDEEARYWVLWRDAQRLSQFRPVDESEFTVLSLAVRGEPFSALCEALLEWHCVEESSVLALRYLTGWLEQGLLTRLVTAAAQEGPQPA